MSRESLSHRLASLLLRKPFYSGLFLFVIVGLSASLLPGLEMEAGYESFYAGPLRAIRDKVDDHFVNDDFIFIVYETDDVFSSHSLTAIRGLGEQLEKLTLQVEAEEVPVVARLTSLTNVKDLVGSDFSYRTYSLVPEEIPQEQSELDEIRKRARNNRVINDSLLGNDDSVAIAVLRLPKVFKDAQKAQAVAEIRALLTEWERQDPSIDYQAAGMPVVDADAVRFQEQDLGTYLPLGYLLLLVVLYLFTRRVIGVVAAVLMASINIVGTLAALVLVGGSVDPASSTLPLILLALTVAMFVHLASEFGKNSRERPGQDIPLITLRELIPPIFVAMLTTSIGFASLATSDMPLVQRFGLAAAIGIMVGFMVVIALFTLLIRIWRPESVVSPRGIAVSEVFDRMLTGLARFVSKRRHAVVVVGLIYLVVIVVGISRITVDFEEMETFAKSTTIRQATDFMDEHLGGTTVYVASVIHPDRDHFLKPEVLAKVDALAEHMRDKFGMARVTSPTDYVKIMHREFFNGDAKQHRLPDNAEQTSQLLLLNNDTQLFEHIDENNQGVRLVGRNDRHNAQAIYDTFIEIESYLAEQFPVSQGYWAHGTGIQRLNSDMVTRFVDNLSVSLLLSFMAIFAIIFVMFRSVRAGLVSILPNAIPVATGLGLMGWLSINLDPYTVCISTIILGIAVDDTVHFIQGLMMRLRVHGDLEKAIVETFHMKGPAIIWTSISICTGFSLLLLSHFHPVGDFGLLICIAMIAAVVGDLVFLPAVLLVFKTKLGVEPAQE